MVDVTTQRAALAETRARIDAALGELTEHVPDKQDLQATAMKVGGAVVGVVIGVGLLTAMTKSRLHNRRTRSDAKSYAKAVLSALPEMAGAYMLHQAAAPAAPAKAAKTTVDSAGQNPPRGGLGTAVLMAASVIGGVAASQALGRGNDAG